MAKKKKEESKAKGGRAVDPAAREPEGRLYVCHAPHDVPQETGFRKYKAGDIETFKNTPPAAFWRPQDEIKERKDIDNAEY